MITISNKPIARGRTAEIYAWDEGWIVKLFHDWVSEEKIKYEARISHLIHTSGLPVPATGEIVNMNGRIGLIYQRIDGFPMWPDGLTAAPWRIFHFARRTAELHALIHDSPIMSEVPPQRERLINKIHDAVSLPADVRKKVLAALQKLPNDYRLCHGDFHPANILITVQKEFIIDWIDATLGNPVADVARTTIILLGAAARQIQQPFYKWVVHLFHTIYLNHYFSLRPASKHEYALWLPVVAAARMSENITELDTWLFEQTVRHLKNG